MTSLATPRTVLAPRELVALAAEPARLAVAVEGVDGGTMAEALGTLRADDAAHVVAALPVELGTAVLESRAMRDLAAVLERLTDRWAARLLLGVTAPRRAAIFRVLAPRERTRLRAALAPRAREELDLLLRWPAGTVGSAMTPDAVPAALALRLAPGASLDEGVHFLARHDLDAAPVVDDGETLLGVLRATDAREALAAASAGRRRARRVAVLAAVLLVALLALLEVTVATARAHGL